MNKRNEEIVLKSFDGIKHLYFNKYDYKVKHLNRRLDDRVINDLVDEKLISVSGKNILIMDADHLLMLTAETEQ